MEYKYIVCTECITYNHSRYIEHALQGLAMQETDFPVINIVVDDASSDGESYIIRKWVQDNINTEAGCYYQKEFEYGEEFYGCHKKKRNIFFAIILLAENHYQTGRNHLKAQYIAKWKEESKYISFCEGDDYWVDPLKLQKQVSFLEANPEYGLVYTNHYNRTGDEITTYYEKGYTEFKDIVIGGGIGTLTSCLRLDLYWKYLDDIKPRDKHWLMGDAPLWKYVAYNSKIKFLPDFTAVYRILPNSASHFTNYEKKIAFIESGYDIQCFFINKYVVGKEKEAMVTIVDRKRIKAVFNTLYSNNNRKRIQEFMKGKWMVLDTKTRVYYYSKYLFLIFKEAISTK